MTRYETSYDQRLFLRSLLGFTEFDRKGMGRRTMVSMDGRPGIYTEGNGS